MKAKQQEIILQSCLIKENKCYLKCASKKGVGTTASFLVIKCVSNGVYIFEYLVTYGAYVKTNCDPTSFTNDVG